MNDHEAFLKIDRCHVYDEMGKTYVDSGNLFYIFAEGQKFERERWISKFKEFSCIKNDKWFLDWLKDLDVKEVEGVSK